LTPSNNLQHQRKMSRKFFVGGNWKMNGSKNTNLSLIEGLNKGPRPDKSTMDLLVAPPIVYLSQVQHDLSSDFLVGAQNIHSDPSGAFTGEVSPTMLKDVGVNWVILGHSERRNIFGESNEFVGKKGHSAVNHGLSIIFCCGELLKDRQQGKTEDIVFAQLAPIKDLKDWSKVVLAYEPVWAIGTGVVATPQQAQETQASIRKWLATNVSQEVANSIRIIYGGSVKPQNCEELAKQPDIDGFLVGGASLQSNDFLGIINGSAQALKTKGH